MSTIGNTGAAESGGPIGLAVALAADVLTVTTVTPALASTGQTALEAAQELHALGLNVLPMPIGAKAGYAWTPVRHTRLLAADLPAVFEGRCNVAVLTGRASGNLFVLDCESEPAFERALLAMRRRGIPLWAVTTARGGHIYLRSGEGEVKSIAPGRLPDLEVRGQGGYVLAPPSIHPTGAVYTWLAREGAAPPVVPLALMDFLCDTNGQPVALEARRRGNGGGPRFNRATRDFLERGASLPEGERHNRFLYACRNYRDCGLSYADMERDLAPLALASGLPPAEVASVMAWAEENTEPKTRQRLDLPNAAAFDWSGRTARTDYAVFAALVERARLGGYEGGVFRASWRELMGAAGIADYHTLQRALTRLQARQLVERVPGKDKHSGAALWRFGVAAAAKCAQITALYFAPLESSSAVIYALFQPAERRILAAVMTAAVPLRTRQDIAWAAGLAPGVVQNALRTEGPLRVTRAIVKEGGAWKPGEVDALEVQKRADRAEAKRYRIARRSAEERARNAAVRLIAGRRRGGG